MCEKLGIRQVPGPRERVGHPVLISVDEADFVVVPVVALVHAGHAAGVGTSLIRGDGALVVSRDGWGVVAQGGQSAFANIELVGGYVSLSEHCCLFEVTVGEVTVGVVEGHQALLEAFGEAFTPKDGPVVLGEEHTSHANLAGINRPKDAWVVWDDLAQSCGPIHQAAGEPLEVCQVVAYVLGDLDAVLVRVLKPELQG